MEFAPNNNIFENIKSNDSINYMEYRFLDDDFEGSIGFDDVADDDLEDVETNNNDKSNNIFLIDNYLNHDVKNDNVILNLINPPNSYREVSIAFSRNNINNLLKGKINNKQLIFRLKHGGKNKVSIEDKELERIIYKYIETVKSLNLRPFSYFDEDVVTSFINFYKDGTINSIVSYYLKSVQVRNKKNSSNSKNIMFTFNVDKFRELHFGITPDCMNFNPHEDREMFILDYIRMYWELYMLLVFMDICNITEDNEKAYFVQFYKYITLAIYKVKCQSLRRISTELLMLKVDNKEGVIDNGFNIIAGFKYSDYKAIDSDFKFFKFRKNGKWGLIDRDDNIIIQPKYDDLRGIDEHLNYLSVKLDRKIFMIDRGENIIDDKTAEKIKAKENITQVERIGWRVQRISTKEVLVNDDNEILQVNMPDFDTIPEKIVKGI